MNYRSPMVGLRAFDGLRAVSCPPPSQLTQLLPLVFTPVWPSLLCQTFQTFSRFKLNFDSRVKWQRVSFFFLQSFSWVALHNFVFIIHSFPQNVERRLWVRLCGWFLKWGKRAAQLWRALLSHRLKVPGLKPHWGQGLWWVSDLVFPGLILPVDVLPTC